MKTLRIGADPFPPYQYYDDNGQIQGTDYLTVKAVVEKMGYKAEYIIDDWSKIEKMLIDKEIHMAFQVQKTPEREKLYYFSDKLRDAKTVIVTSSDNIHHQNIDDLFVDGSKLGVIENYKYGDIIDSIEEGNKTNYKSLEDLLNEVDNGLISYGVADYGVYNFMNKGNVYKNLVIMENLIFNRPLFVVFKDNMLRDQFNKHLI